MPYYNSYQQSYGGQYNPGGYGPQNNFMPQYSNTPQPQQTVQPSSSINWVQGEIGARAYPVAAGMSVLLMDSEGQNFYIKSADMMGMPSLKKYAYSEIVEEPLRIESHNMSSEPQVRDYDTAKLASREEVKALQEEIKSLEEKLANLEVENRNLQEQSKTTTGGRKNA